MNKRIAFYLIVFSILIFVQVPVFGAARQTEIRVKPGQKAVIINQHLIPAESAFYKNDTLMVPLRIYADLIGASLENSSGQKAVIVFRNNKNIKFVLGKKLAYINGIKKETTCAPVVKNGTTMVPLRILAEGFNAVISKDLLTGEIISLFPFRNYQKRFNYIKDGNIGDSYYGWSVLFPKGCILDERKPSGTSTLVKNLEKGYYFYIFNTVAEANLKEQNLLDELKSYVVDERVIKKDLVTEKGRKCGLLILESEDEICEYKAVLKNGRLYQIHLYSVDKSGFLDQQKGKLYQDIINSFNVDYSGNLAGTADINEICNGMYAYRENSYGWEIDLPTEINLEAKKNDYSFEIFDENGRQNGLTVGVNIYPLNKGETLETYSKDKINAVYQDINNDCISQLIVKDSEIGGKLAKKIYYKIDTEDRSFYFFNSIIFGEQCKFHVYVYGDSKFFQGENIGLGDRIIQSFLLPDNPINGIISLKNSNKCISDIIDYESVDGWKIKYPSDWIKEKNGATVVIKNDSGLSEFQITRKDLGYTINAVKEDYGNFENFKIVKEEIINEKRLSMNMISFEYDIDDLKYYCTFYIFKINGQCCQVGYKIAEIAKSKDNIKKLNDIWQSLEFSSNSPQVLNFKNRIITKNF